MHFICELGRAQNKTILRKNKENEAQRDFPASLSKDIAKAELEPGSCGPKPLSSAGQAGLLVLTCRQGQKNMSVHDGRELRWTSQQSSSLLFLCSFPLMNFMATWPLFCELSGVMWNDTLCILSLKKLFFWASWRVLSVSGSSWPRIIRKHSCENLCSWQNHYDGYRALPGPLFSLYSSLLLPSLNMWRWLGPLVTCPMANAVLDTGEKRGNKVDSAPAPEGLAFQRGTGTPSGREGNKMNGDLLHRVKDGDGVGKHVCFRKSDQGGRQRWGADIWAET